MKLKHYYSMFTSNLSEHKDILADVAFSSILSKVLRLCDKNLDGIQTQITHKTPISDLVWLLGNDFRDVIQILHCLNLNDGDYFKYYVLDKLTNGIYIDALLSCIYGCNRHRLDFVFDFSISNFTESKPQPALYVEYKYGYDVDIVVSSIVYQNPFNGDMELEDFLSMIVADPFYLLNSDINAKYLLEKVMCNVSCIPYSQSKFMNIIGVPQPDKSITQVSRYWTTVDLTYGNTLGKPVIKLDTSVTGKFTGHETHPTDITTLTENLKVPF